MGNSRKSKFKFMNFFEISIDFFPYLQFYVIYNSAHIYKELLIHE